MEHLAGLGYIHRDLAARNVLVSEHREPGLPADEMGEFVSSTESRLHVSTSHDGDCILYPLGKGDAHKYTT